MPDLIRPRPPADMIGDGLAGDRFEPSRDLLAWIIGSFIGTDAPLHNPDHLHLSLAQIGVLWTNVPNGRNGRRIVGQAEFQPPGSTQGKWARARAACQIIEWFGELPDFLLTFDAEYAAACSDLEFCALVEHELYHCGMALDEFGIPRFSRSTGMPVFAMRPHDVEEFVGVVKRYGADAAHIASMLEAANAAPEFTGERVAIACGACR